MQKRNFQKELDAVIDSIPEGSVPTLLLHACCAPCSSYTLEYLSKYFAITVFFYDPNISPESEFKKRADELRRLLGEMKFTNPVRLTVAEYDGGEFYSAVRGLESEPEGGKRCEVCFRLRLEKTARFALAENFDYFATTLSISPYKNSQLLGEISEEISERLGVANLPCDLKKRGGYKRSIELSKEYSLYRQDYCGCVFSKLERDRRKAERAARSDRT